MTQRFEMVFFMKRAHTVEAFWMKIAYTFQPGNLSI